MLAVITEVLLQATWTKGISARLTRLLTTMTYVFLTSLAASDALATEVATARFAVAITRLTQAVFAFLARVTAVGVDGITAVRAGHAIPIRERHVGAAAVVR